MSKLTKVLCGVALIMPALAIFLANTANACSSGFGEVKTPEFLINN